MHEAKGSHFWQMTLHFCTAYEQVFEIAVSECVYEDRIWTHCNHYTAPLMNILEEVLYNWLELQSTAFCYSDSLRLWSVICNEIGFCYAEENCARYEEASDYWLFVDCWLIQSKSTLNWSSYNAPSMTGWRRSQRLHQNSDLSFPILVRHKFIWSNPNGQSVDHIH